MLLSAVDVITVTPTLDGSRNTYGLPLSLASIDHVDFTSTDLLTYIPNFIDYTMSGKCMECTWNIWRWIRDILSLQ